MAIFALYYVHMSRFKTPNRSFSTRLSLWFTGCSAAILLASMGISLYFVYHKMKKDEVELAQHSLQVYVDEISNTFKIAEVVAQNASSSMHFFLEYPDSMLNMLRPVLDKNEDIYGVAFSVDTAYYENKVIAPYLHRTKKVGEYELTNISEFWLEDWFREAKHSGKSFWTKPYVGRMAQKPMTDYCIPVYDSSGKFAGVFGVDVTLEWISQLISRQKISGNSYIRIVDSDGKEVISHGYPLSDEDSYTFTAPIENVGWVMTICSSEKEISKPIHLLRDLLLLLFIFGLTALLLATRVIVGKLAKPVVRFANAADEISNGNFNTELPEVKTDDELKLLRDSLDNMQHELSSFITDLKVTTENQTRLENELHIARTIQMNMLPKEFPDYLYAKLNPAKEVGGDLYNFLIRSDKLFFIIGDVSGKGIPASLIMAVTSKLFRNRAYHIDSPGRIAMSLNHSLSENNPQNFFVTFFVGVLNLKSGLLTYCNAGHNPPILFHESRIEFMDVKVNLAAGIINSAEYEESSIQLNGGDKILMFTDGVTEAKNKLGEFYSESRLLELAQNNSFCDSKGLVERIVDDVSAFSVGMEQNDDLTLFSFTYKSRDDNKS